MIMYNWCCLCGYENVKKSCNLERSIPSLKYKKTKFRLYHARTILDSIPTAIVLKILLYWTTDRKREIVR